MTCFNVRDRESGIEGCDRLLHHEEAVVVGCRARSLFVGRIVGRDPDDLLEVGQLAGSVGDRQMAPMNWVKGAAEDCYSSHIRVNCKRLRSKAAINLL